MNVSLITTAADYIGTLPAMLDHYRSLGVGDIFIHANAENRDDPRLDAIARIAADYDAQVASILIRPWSSADNTYLYTIPRNDNPADWFILADPDEFQTYPEDLLDVIRFCDRHGYDFVEGCLIDRLSGCGTLRPIDADRSIWAQFPIGSVVSARLLGAVINKIVAAKGHVRLSHGQHQSYTGVGCPVSDLYIPVHHFKWADDLLHRLETRLASHPRSLYTSECERFLAYYRQRDRIEVEDHTLLAGRCEPDYPYFDVLREWRTAAAWFSTELAVRDRRKEMRALDATQLPPALMLSAATRTPGPSQVLSGHI